jgi:hypothetical protein
MSPKLQVIPTKAAAVIVVFGSGDKKRGDAIRILGKGSPSGAKEGGATHAAGQVCISIGFCFPSFGFQN